MKNDVHAMKRESVHDLTEHVVYFPHRNKNVDLQKLAWGVFLSDFY